MDPGWKTPADVLNNPACIMLYSRIQELIPAVIPADMG